VLPIRAKNQQSAMESNSINRCTACYPIWLPGRPIWKKDYSDPGPPWTDALFFLDSVRLYDVYSIFSCFSNLRLRYIGWFALPIKLTWLSAAFLMLGGGVQMLAALILMVLADVTPADQRWAAIFNSSPLVFS
jgi:hypothetical protein